MSQPNKPYWRGLYLTGAVGAAGLVIEAVAKVRVPPQAHIMLLLGWVFLIFSLVSKWIVDNSSALNSMDDDSTTDKTKGRRTAQTRAMPVCERTSNRPKRISLGKRKIPVKKGKTL